MVNTPSTVPINVGTPSPSREKGEGMAKMNFQLIEKIRTLVKNSPLLNETERQEWLMLLELMNDKQLVELQRILEPASQLVSKQYTVNSTQDIGNKEISKSVPPHPASGHPLPQGRGKNEELLGEGGNKVGEPHLKHILNFPSTPASRHRDVTSEVFVDEKTMVGSTPSIVPAAAGTPSPSREKEKGMAKSGFFSSLKNILGKKELKPGHAEFQLELSSSIPQSGTMADKKDKNVEIPDALKTILHHKDLGHPAVLKKIIENPPHPAFGHPLPQGRGGKEAPLVPTPVKVVPPVAKSKPISFSSPVNKFIPGVQLPNLPEGASVKGLDKARPERVNRQPVHEILVPKKQLVPDMSGSNIENKLERKETPVQLRSSFAHVNLKNLEDAAKLSPAVLESADINELAKKIKDLINSEGYYQTFFSLEKSTLFKQYLLTGLDCLYKEVSVEELAQEHPNQYLTKEQFEKFTDLLMISQSG